MEILLELFLTVSLSIIFTSLFIKLFSMHPNTTDKNDQFLEETLKVDELQWMPLKEDMIKVENYQGEANSSVEFHNFIGVDKEDKLFSMHPANTNKDHCTQETLLNVDKFQWMPLQEEVIKVEECYDEGKSFVEFHKVVRDIEAVDSKEAEMSVMEGDHEDDMDSVGSEENGEEGKLCEIEIESVDEEGKEEMDDWEHIGRKDFEELIGNKAGFYGDVASAK